MTYIVVLLMIVGLVAIALSPRGRKAVAGGSYFSKIPVSQVEQVAYWRLKEAVGEEKVVLSQVAFSSFIGVEGGTKNDRYSKFARAKQKVADFVICNKDFSIFAIVEIDDSTHNTEKDKARDAITAEAGIETLRLQAKNIPKVEEIRKALML